MRGVLTFGPGRLRRVAVLAGVTALVAAGSVLGAAQAHAAVPGTFLGNGKGTLVVSPATGPVAGSPQPVAKAGDPPGSPGHGCWTPLARPRSWARATAASYPFLHSSVLT